MTKILDTLCYHTSKVNAGILLIFTSWQMRTGDIRPTPIAPAYATSSSTMHVQKICGAPMRTLIVEIPACINRAQSVSVVIIRWSIIITRQERTKITL